MKKQRSAHEKFIDKLNKRIQRVKKTFGEDAVYQNMMEDINSIEGAILTKSGLISAKTKDKIVLQTLEANIETIKNILDRAYEEEYEGSDIKKSEIPREHLVQLANMQALERASYDVTLSTFYNNKPSDFNSVKARDYADLQRQLKHRGRKLTEDEIVANTQAIRKFLEG